SDVEPAPSQNAALAIGTAFSAPVAAEDVGRRAHVVSVAGAVRAAIANAGIERLDDVHFVQVKCPCVTVARAAAAIAAGKTPLTNGANKSMAYAPAARARAKKMVVSRGRARALGRPLRPRGAKAFRLRGRVAAWRFFDPVAAR